MGGGLFGSGSPSVLVRGRGTGARKDTSGTDGAERRFKMDD